MSQNVAPTSSEIVAKFGEQTFAAAIFNQLKKEFTKVGVEMNFDTEDLSSYAVFKQKLTQELEIIMKDARSRLNQLLYLSDLPESQVDEVFNHADFPLEELADLLLRRTGQKIYFREKYKNNQL